MGATHEKEHSSKVELYLHVGGTRYELADVGPHDATLRNPNSLANGAEDAVLEIIVDGVLERKIVKVSASTPMQNQKYLILSTGYYGGIEFLNAGEERLVSDIGVNGETPGAGLYTIEEARQIIAADQAITGIAGVVRHCWLRLSGSVSRSSPMDERYTELSADVCRCSDQECVRRRMATV